MLILKVGRQSHVVLLDWNDFALGTELDFRCIVVRKGHTAAVSFELAADDDHLFANQLVSHKSILAGNSVVCARLHEFGAEDL